MARFGSTFFYLGTRIAFKKDDSPKDIMFKHKETGGNDGLFWGGNCLAYSAG